MPNSQIVQKFSGFRKAERSLKIHQSCFSSSQGESVLLNRTFRGGSGKVHKLFFLLFQSQTRTQPAGLQRTWVSFFQQSGSVGFSCVFIRDWINSTKRRYCSIRPPAVKSETAAETDRLLELSFMYKSVRFLFFFTV